MIARLAGNKPEELRVASSGRCRGEWSAHNKQHNGQQREWSTTSRGYHWGSPDGCFAGFAWSDLVGQAGGSVPLCPFFIIFAPTAVESCLYSCTLESLSLWTTEQSSTGATHAGRRIEITLINVYKQMVHHSADDKQWNCIKSKSTVLYA